MQTRDAPEWSALQVRTGKEIDVLRRARSLPGINAMAPIESPQQRRERKPRPMLPGYVLVRWPRNPEAYRLIRTLPGVIRFLGDGDPYTIPDEQMRYWIALDRHCTVDMTPAPARRTGTVTVITGGALAPYSPYIVGYNGRARRVKLRIPLANDIRTVTAAVDMIPDESGG